jgi:hypothetical protein
MRRLFQAVALATVIATVFAAPALADKPVTFEDSDTFIDVNPCDGSEHEITIDLVVSIHEHQNSFVVHLKRSGTTDSGFTMIAGTESFVANNSVERGTFQDQWQHPDGSKFRASASFVFNANTGELLVDRFALVCLGSN